MNDFWFKAIVLTVIVCVFMIIHAICYDGEERRGGGEWTNSDLDFFEFFDSDFDGGSDD